MMYALGPDAKTAISDAIASDEYAQYGISTAYTEPEQLTAAIATSTRSAVTN
ncbi:hypothetical protein [Nonomuraea sp. NPDC003709]|uniref:hypothetical protein n=1 Tax=Nonomuraea sp. NPDC003709 TaxID=3154450 RepID=UPI0033BF5C0B